MHYSITLISSSSLYWLKTSKFSLKVEFMRTGYWSITVIYFRRFLIDIPLMFFLSIHIDPPDNYVIHIIVLSKVVLPEPVRPTIPIFSPGLILQLTPFKTFGRSDLYLAITCRNYISPKVIYFFRNYYFSCHFSQY